MHPFPKKLTPTPILEWFSSRKWLRQKWMKHMFFHHDLKMKNGCIKHDRKSSNNNPIPLYLNLLKLLGKKFQTYSYSLKWWFDDDLPWKKVRKKNLKNKKIPSFPPSTRLSSNFQTFQAIQLHHPYHSPLYR